jgi:serine/threonine protein kinase
MSYLVEKNLVHRDLAARNVLVQSQSVLDLEISFALPLRPAPHCCACLQVDNQYVAKIADYGLARQDNYTVENTRALP